MMRVDQELDERSVEPRGAISTRISTPGVVQGSFAREVLRGKPSPLELGGTRVYGANHDPFGLARPG
jgi:hypothetical protein